MKAAFASVGFALGASAASLVARDQCCFSLTAAGGVSGVVGQLADGQNRIDQTSGLANTEGEYCLSNGQITDSEGRGCILTPPTTQFQCDVGATPTGGFSVVNGELEYNGNSEFYACPTGDNGGYNIYTVPVANQDLCTKITLSTGGKCNAASTATAHSSVKTVYSTQYKTITSSRMSMTTIVPTSMVATTVKTSATSASSSACPTTLSGEYQFPHGIIPINKEAPTMSYGTQYFAYIGNGNSTVFNFDFPESYAGKTCSLVFLFPEQSQLETSSFTLTGAGGLTFEDLSSTAPLDVTYDTCPASAGTIGTLSSVTPGNSYVVSTYACPAGVSGSVVVSSTGSLDLTYFQDYNPSPIGLYVTTC